MRELPAIHEQVLTGQSRAVFISGEPGIGKTTLVEQFLVHARVRSDLVEAQGHCMEGFAGPEPYCPIFEALRELSKTADRNRLVRALVELAPSWASELRDLIPPGQAAAGRQVGPDERSRMVRQACTLFEALATERPLVLVLEDLHWADPTTVDLLQRIVRIVPPNRVLMAVVTNVIPTHPATFEEAQNRIRVTLERQKLDQLVAKRADELVTKANSTGGDLEKAAKFLGLELKTPPEFDRAGAVEGLGPASSINDAFTRPSGSVFGPVPVQGNRIVVKVVSHVPADMSELAAQRSAIRDELKSKIAVERYQLFEVGVREQLIKDGKVKIHQDVINRLIANYRG